MPWTLSPFSTHVSNKDITDLSRVINYDLPDQAPDYIHRIGRTGRAGKAGEAISLVSRDDFRSLCYIEKLLGEAIPRKTIEGFEPTKIIPPSDLKGGNRRK